MHHHLPQLSASGDSQRVWAVLAPRAGRKWVAGRPEKCAGGWSPDWSAPTHRPALLVRLAASVPALAPTALPLIRVALECLQRNEEKNYEKRGQGRGERFKNEQGYVHVHILTCTQKKNSHTQQRRTYRSSAPPATRSTIPRHAVWTLRRRCACLCAHKRKHKILEQQIKHRLSTTALRLTMATQH